MKPVAYHRLAASELIKSARILRASESNPRRSLPLRCGDNAAENSAQSRTRQAWQAWNPQLENETVSLPNCLSRTARPILDCGRRAFEPQTRLLDSAATVILRNCSGQRPDSYQPRATPWVSVGFCSVAGQRPASEGALGQTDPNPDAASGPASIPRHSESRFQRSAWSLAVKPRALPWAGMNDAVGVSNRPAVPPEQLRLFYTRFLC